MMGRIQDVQKPKKENFLAGILRTAEKYCLSNSGETQMFQTHKENKQKRRVVSAFCFILLLKERIPKL